MDGESEIADHVFIRKKGRKLFLELGRQVDVVANLVDVFARRLLQQIRGVRQMSFFRRKEGEGVRFSWVRFVRGMSDKSQIHLEGFTESLNAVFEVIFANTGCGTTNRIL